jgi:hypothetical protein
MEFKVCTCGSKADQSRFEAFGLSPSLVCSHRTQDSIGGIKRRLTVSPGRAYRWSNDGRPRLAYTAIWSVVQDNSAFMEADGVFRCP